MDDYAQRIEAAVTRMRDDHLNHAHRDSAFDVHDLAQAARMADAAEKAEAYMLRLLAGEAA